MAQPTRRKRLRPVSNDRAKLLRERKAILRRSHGPPRCQWPEGCTQAADDPHETTRRSQYREGPADVDVIVYLCRAHHDWVGDHPREAHDRYRLSIPRWELALDQRARARQAAVIEAELAAARVLPSEPVGNTSARRVRTSLWVNQAALDWADALAARTGRQRSDVLRETLSTGAAHEAEVIARLTGASPSPPAQPATITGRKRGPVPKKKTTR